MAKKEIGLNRLNARRTLLEQFESERRRLDSVGVLDSFDKIHQRAMELATSEKMLTALDIRHESDKIRNRYGRHLFGQSLLMGRRLIEAGSRFVTVTWDCPGSPDYSWDSHVNSVELKNHLLPGFDQTFGALLTDLEDRGLLDDTLVVAVSEMGRRPNANSEWGCRSLHCSKERK